MTVTLLLAALACAVLAGVALAEAQNAWRGTTWKYLLYFTVCTVASGVFLGLAMTPA